MQYLRDERDTRPADHPVVQFARATVEGQVLIQARVHITGTYNERSNDPQIPWFSDSAREELLRNFEHYVGYRYESSDIFSAITGTAKTISTIERLWTSLQNRLSDSKGPSRNYESWLMRIGVTQKSEMDEEFVEDTGGFEYFPCTPLTWIDTTWRGLMIVITLSYVGSPRLK